MGTLKSHDWWLSLFLLPHCRVWWSSLSVESVGDIKSCCHLFSFPRCFLSYLLNLNSNCGSATPPMQLFPTVTVVSDKATNNCSANYFQRKFSQNPKLRAGENVSVAPAVRAAEVWGGDGDGGWDGVGAEQADHFRVWVFFHSLPTYRSPNRLFLPPCASVAAMVSPLHSEHSFKLSIPAELFAFESQPRHKLVPSEKADP